MAQKQTVTPMLQSVIDTTLVFVLIYIGLGLITAMVLWLAPIA